jgi:NAD(P)-dependent dehydrogenase (short-subunit alcohol dehydrogenase family)
LGRDGRLISCSGIGLETSILFAKEGANVLMTDISQEALDKAVAKVKQLVPNAGKVEAKVGHTSP